MTDLKLTVVASKSNDETSIWNRIFIDPHEAWKYCRKCQERGADMLMFTQEVLDIENIEKLYEDIQRVRRENFTHAKYGSRPEA
jgi:hypothetical protein